MARLSRKLRVCKWVGTFGCVLFMAAFVGSGWSSLGFTCRAGQDVCSLWLDDGNIDFYWGTWDPQVPLGWHLMYTSLARWSWFSWLPSIRPYAPAPAFHIARLPLWLPFLVLLIPTLLLWRRDRHKPGPGFCRRCGYDLTSNTSGVCPECGMVITEECYPPASHPAEFRPGASGESAAVKRDE